MSFSISSGALESPDLLLPYSVISLVYTKAIILIITLTFQIFLHLHTCKGTGAPNCGTLNREKCKSRAQTCGSCKNGYYGEEGYSNTICASIGNSNNTLSSGVISSVTTVGNSCTDNSDCEGFEKCSAGE